MTTRRPSIWTTVLTVALALTLMVLAGVLEVSMRVQPPSWMQQRRSLIDSTPVREHVQSFSTALGVMPADENTSRRKLQVSAGCLHASCTMHMSPIGQRSSTLYQPGISLLCCRAKPHKLSHISVPLH